MRNLRDLAVVLTRVGQVRRAVQSKDEMREQRQHGHRDGDAAPVNP